MKRNFYMIFFVLITCNLYAQKDYTALFFKEGVPELKSGKEFDFDDPVYAQIPTGALNVNIFLVVEDKNTDKSKCWLLSEKADDGDLVYSGFSFQLTKWGQLLRTLDVSIYNRTAYIPIEMALYLENNFVLYKWLSKGENNEPVPILKEEKLPVGTEFPSLVLKNIKGEDFNTNDFGGKITVINWWATNCLPCIIEIPGLNKLVGEYNDINFIAIIHDKKNMSKFLKEHKFLYKQYYSDKDLLTVLGGIFPRHIVLDKNKNIVSNETGGSEEKYEQLKIVLDKLINQ